MPVARQQGEHPEGLLFVGRLAQHYPVQGHYRVGGNDHRIGVGLGGHRLGLFQGDLPHQLRRRQVPVHVLVNVGGDDAEIPHPHLLQQRPPPGAFGGQNDIHAIFVPFHYCPVEPKPPVPRPVASSSAVSSSWGSTTGVTTSWAIRSPGWMV